MLGEPLWPIALGTFPLIISIAIYSKGSIRAVEDCITAKRKCIMHTAHNGYYHVDYFRCEHELCEHKLT